MTILLRMLTQNIPLIAGRGELWARIDRVDESVARVVIVNKLTGAIVFDEQIITNTIYRRIPVDVGDYAANLPKVVVDFTSVGSQESYGYSEPLDKPAAVLIESTNGLPYVGVRCGELSVSWSAPVGYVIVLDACQVPGGEVLIYAYYDTVRFKILKFDAPQTQTVELLEVRALDANGNVLNTRTVSVGLYNVEVVV